MPPRHTSILTVNPRHHLAQWVLTLPRPLVSAQQAVIQEAQCFLPSKCPLPSKAIRAPTPFLGEDLDLPRPIPDPQLCFLKAEEYSAQEPCGNVSVPSTAQRPPEGTSHPRSAGQGSEAA